jgi:class 3 adenylate cyclase
MTSNNLKRKLAAILSADVKGYSRLMGEDEEWTLRTLNNYKGIIRNLVGEHRGRVISSPGDNVLAEFVSVVDAVQCGVEIQQVLRAKNAMLPATRRMEFRIGINLWDVIEEGYSGQHIMTYPALDGLPRRVRSHQLPPQPLGMTPFRYFVAGVIINVGCQKKER